MSEDKQKTDDRLKEGFASLDKTYSAWIGQKANKSARDELQHDLQEMRRVLARIEIELARSETSERSSRPVPIPEHRSSHKKGKPEYEPGNAIDVEIKEGSSQSANNQDRNNNNHNSRNEKEEQQLPAFVVGDNGDGKKTLRAKHKKDDNQ